MNNCPEKLTKQKYDCCLCIYHSCNGNEDYCNEMTQKYDIMQCCLHCKYSNCSKGVKNNAE